MLVLRTVEEHAIKDDLARRSVALLEASFPDPFAGRTLHKQSRTAACLRSRRTRTWARSGSTCAAADGGGEVVRIAGLVDLCVPTLRTAAAGAAPRPFSEPWKTSPRGATSSSSWPTSPTSTCAMVVGASRPPPPSGSESKGCGPEAGSSAISGTASC